MDYMSSGNGGHDKIDYNTTSQDIDMNNLNTNMNNQSSQHIDAKQFFPSLDQSVRGKRLVYLENAASTQIPTSVIAVFDTHYKKDHANIHRGIHTLAERSTKKYEDTRDKVARFIGAKPQEIIFTQGTTMSTNLVAYSLLCPDASNERRGRLRLRGEILVTEMDHHSNFVVWQQIAKNNNLVFRIIPVTPDFRLDMDAAREMITEKTLIVAVPHVSNVLGTVNPVKELASIAHNKGAMIYVDGAQAVAHAAVNFMELGADFYSFSGHKMYAPTGIGVLCVKEDIMAQMKPFMYGGGMIEDVGSKDTTFAQGPAKFEAGTPNIVGAICMGAAVDFIASIGMERITAHESALTQRLLSGLKRIDGIAVIGPQDNISRTGVVSFVVEGMHAHDVASALDEEGIAVRAGHHCAQPLAKRFGIPATSRASVAIYNDEHDIDALISALAQIAKESAEGMTDPKSLGSDQNDDEHQLYRDNIMEHFRNPRNKRKIAFPNACKHDINPACGDSITVQMKIDGGVIKEIGFEGNGCAISQAAMSMLSEKILGKTTEEVEAIDRNDIVAMLGIPIGIVRMKCAMLGIRTTQSALNDIKT